MAAPREEHRGAIARFYQKANKRSSTVMSQIFASLLWALARSQRQLEACSGGRLGATLRPILMRRRRAIAALRALVPAEGLRWPGPVPGPRRTDCEERMLHETEVDLLDLYDATLRQVPPGTRLHALLREQRFETEQARWSLGALVHRLRPVQRHPPALQGR